jgi:hypothetical protein
MSEIYDAAAISRAGQKRFRLKFTALLEASCAVNTRPL